MLYVDDWGDVDFQTATSSRSGYKRDPAGSHCR